MIRPAKRCQSVIMHTCYSILVAVALCGCQSSSPNQASAAHKVSKSRALDLAKQKFCEQYPGRLRAYKVSISSDLYKDAWYVLFTGTGDYAVPGGYTPMLVDKTTGRIEILHSD